LLVGALLALAFAVRLYAHTAGAVGKHKWHAAILLQRELCQLRMVADGIERLEQMAGCERGIAVEHDLCVVQIRFDGSVKGGRESKVRGCELLRSRQQCKMEEARI
jgi:hypothetical protein